jgi:DNA polymerase III delta prime subunit
MNIKRAKEEIKNSILAYLKKDEYGEYKIPVTNQRPLLIIGPPGIGKTAIMEQVAGECKIGIVSYTITHHTRQSAIGLPFIEKKEYGGREYSITEYTMSEIIASVYKKIEETRLQEGILFIDEINCVSETLSATMLQFLKEKSFGNHKVPKGWIIVAAGNPPEYNKSVREFDIVTLDRVRKINVKEDYKVWKEYAYKQSVHEAIITYLDIKKENFYLVETMVEGKEFVTARGWEDLSKILITYEELGLIVDEGLILQYIQHRKIAKDFANYLDFYNKYKTDYSVENILKGQANKAALRNFAEAPFDERITVIGLLLGKLYEYFKEVYMTDLYVNELFNALKELKLMMLDETSNMEPVAYLEKTIDNKYKLLEKLMIASHIDKNMERSMRKMLDTLESYKNTIKVKKVTTSVKAFDIIKELFLQDKMKRDLAIDKASSALSNGFRFIEEAYGESQEIVIFITELTMNYFSSKFIGEYGSDEYYKYNKEIMFKDKRVHIINEINEVVNIMNKD